MNEIAAKRGLFAKQEILEASTLGGGSPGNGNSVGAKEVMSRIRRYRCKGPKLLGANFFVRKQKLLASHVRTIAKAPDDAGLSLHLS
jgi:hypothetical protein